MNFVHPVAVWRSPSAIMFRQHAINATIEAGNLELLLFIEGVLLCQLI
jgi:hypothetical protein